MTRVLVFDCFSGIAGDMVLGALFGAGADVDGVRGALAKLGLPEFRLDRETVVRGGLACTRAIVETPDERPYSPDQLLAFAAHATLPPRVQERARAAFEALIAAEAAVHGTPTPHLHEAGGVDAVIDVVGTMIALEQLEVDEAVCPVVTVGAGTIVRSAHGAIPAGPGPAAAEMLRRARFACRFVETSHELVTPTGAAILAAVARPGQAVIVPVAIGAGAGTRDTPERPNAVRVFLGEARAGGVTRPLVVLEANIDDLTPALLAHARDRLLADGALDAWTETIGMKKGRQAAKLCALATPADEARLAALMLRETTTLGVRVAEYRRHELARELVPFASSLGLVQMKVAGAGERAEPEFEDVRALAEALGRPALEVHRTVLADWAARAR